MQIRPVTITVDICPLTDLSAELLSDCHMCKYFHDVDLDGVTCLCDIEDEEEE